MEREMTMAMMIHRARCTEPQPIANGTFERVERDSISWHMMMMLVMVEGPHHDDDAQHRYDDYLHHWVLYTSPHPEIHPILSNPYTKTSNKTALL